jgi:hypothetical protein
MDELEMKCRYELYLLVLDGWMDESIHLGSTVLDG